MRAQLIEAHEADFDSHYVDADGKVFIAGINHTGFPFPLTSLTTTYSSGYYKAEEKKKEAICLHFTCGYLKGDIATLTHPEYLVSVPFIIGRNGTVYQLFSSKYWSYHLGSNCAGGNLPQSQRTIGIEISNIGPLKHDPGAQVMRTIYGDAYCGVNESHYYTQLSMPYRGYKYFATYTPEQIASTKALIKYLGEKFSIPTVLPPEEARYNLFDPPTAEFFRGICSHVNFRADGKTDIGPAFPWASIM